MFKSNSTINFTTQANFIHNQIILINNTVCQTSAMHLKWEYNQSFTTWIQMKHQAGIIFQHHTPFCSMDSPIFGTKQTEYNCCAQKAERVTLNMAAEERTIQGLINSLLDHEEQSIDRVSVNIISLEAAGGIPGSCFRSFFLSRLFTYGVQVFTPRWVWSSHPWAFWEIQDGR